nr:recombinase family protein [Bdellovibrio sp. HAGR004]
MTKKSEISKALKKRILIEKIVEDCRKAISKYHASWRPQNEDWPTLEGCAYLRLSTEDQVTIEKGSLEQQVNIAISEAEIRSQAGHVNYKITEFFIEPGLTGRDDDRPEFKRMSYEIKREKFKFVVIKEISRIARDATIWETFFRLCTTSECEIVIRSFPFNPNDPGQLFQLRILSAFAQYESEQTSKRVKESNFSAMVNSGKFNSTHPVLGLDQLKVGDELKVGFYTPNADELKTVEWLMRTFVKFGSFQKTLEESHSKGILNKHGEPFKKHSLHTLLTNKKYIGLWEVNRDNKDKNQKKLMPYEKYEEVELPHGCVVDKKLWAEVQKTIGKVSSDKIKNTKVTKIYLLSGLLKNKDGKALSGRSGVGQHNKERYHYYGGPGVRNMRADSLEQEAFKIVKDIVDKNARLKEAVKRRISDLNSRNDLLKNEAQKIKDKISSLNDEKDSLKKSLIQITKGATEQEIKEIRDEFMRNISEKNSEIETLEQNFKNIGESLKQGESDGFDWSYVAENAEKIQRLIAENDPVSLRTAYQKLFKEIIVGDLDDKGNRPLQFVLRGDDLFDPVNPADYSSVGKELAQKELVKTPNQARTILN